MNRGRQNALKNDRELLLGWDADDAMNRPFGFASASRRIRRGNSQPLTYAGDSHLLTVAPTGAGKGRGVIIPNLLTLPRPGDHDRPQGRKLPGHRPPPPGNGAAGDRARSVPHRHGKKRPLKPDGHFRSGQVHSRLRCGNAGLDALRGTSLRGRSVLERQRFGDHGRPDRPHRLHLPQKRTQPQHAAGADLSR